MMRPLIAALMASALLVGACSNGPSAEDQAKSRKAAAAKKTAAADRAVGADLRSAVSAMKAKRDAKHRINPKIALTALKAKGFTSGTSLVGPTKESSAYCIWATSSKTKRSYVYQSLTGKAKAAAEPVDWCIAAEYASPVALTTEEVKNESLAGAEMALKIKRDDKALSENLQRLAAMVEKDWTISPHWIKPTDATEKRVATKKQKMIDAVMKGFEPTNGLMMGGWFTESHFCLVMYQGSGLRHAAVYQHLDRKVVRVKSGTTECTVGTVPRP